MATARRAPRGPMVADEEVDEYGPPPGYGPGPAYVVGPPVYYATDRITEGTTEAGVTGRLGTALVTRRRFARQAASPRETRCRAD
jgi:hypothetical protein